VVPEVLRGRYSCSWVNCGYFLQCSVVHLVPKSKFYVVTEVFLI
jgi:hypothetical protein